MTRQIIQLREHQPVVLETPEGMVVVRLDRRRRIVMELPGKMQAHRSMERAIKSARFVDEDGCPTYEVLVPTTDDQGRLQGVETPTPLTVTGEGDSGHGD